MFVLFGKARDDRHVQTQERQGVSRIVDSAAVYISLARRRNDRILGVITNTENIIVFHCESFCDDVKDEMAALNIPTAAPSLM
jgi:hypothetical protein